MNKREVTNTIARYVVNPLVSLIAGYVPWWSLLETRGRKSGRPIRNPVGNGLDGNAFWIVAEHGQKAGYVKNIKTDPNVRLRVGGRWRSGVAHVLADDDARERQGQMRRFNAMFVRMMSTDLLTIRIDLNEEE